MTSGACNYCHYVEIKAGEHPGLEGEAYPLSALPSQVFEVALLI